MINHNLNISQMEDLIKNDQYAFIPPEIAESEYGITFAPGQKYNISLCELLVVVDKNTKQIAGFVYKKTHCMARWCIKWDQYQNKVPA